MDAEYTIADDDERWGVQDPESRYELTVRKWRPESVKGLGWAYFDVPCMNSHVQSLIDSGIVVTGRNLEDYPRKVRKISSESRIIEVGAGHGALVPWLCETREGYDEEKRPTVIDAANYTIMHSMMVFALGALPMLESVREYIGELVRRNEIIRNPSRVRLVNMTLGRAIEEHPELRGYADFVVDHCGALLYPETEAKEIGELRGGRAAFIDLEKRVRRMECLLLREGGRIITPRDEMLENEDSSTPLK